MMLRTPTLAAQSCMAVSHGAGGQQCCNQSSYCQSAYSAGSTMPYLLQWRHLQQYPDTGVHIRQCFLSFEVLSLC